MARDYNQLQQEIFQAIDEIVKVNINSLKFDKTIVAKIVDDTNKEYGEYTVTDDNSIFKAYSEIKYSKGMYVYVTIPDGDFNKQKIIVGKYMTDDSEYYSYVSPMESYMDITHNLITGSSNYYNESFSLVANGVRKEKIIWSYNSPIANKGFNRLGIQASFMTLLSKVTKGSYGLRLDVLTSDDDNNKRYYSFKLDSKEMNGNIYNFLFYSPQSAVFNIAEIKNIESMNLVMYQDRNFYKYNEPLGMIRVENPKEEDFNKYYVLNNEAFERNTENFSENKIYYISDYEDFSEGVGVNIFVKDIYISLGYDKSEFEDNEVFLFTLDSEKYNSYATSEENKRKLQVKWIRKNEETGDFEVKESEKEGHCNSLPKLLPLNENPYGAKIHWYVYNRDLKEPDKIAGAFWEEITPKSIISFPENAEEEEKTEQKAIEELREKEKRELFYNIDVDNILEEYQKIESKDYSSIVNKNFINDIMELDVNPITYYQETKYKVVIEFPTQEYVEYLLDNNNDLTRLYEDFKDCLNLLEGKNTTIEQYKRRIQSLQDFNQLHPFTTEANTYTKEYVEGFEIHEDTLNGEISRINTLVKNYEAVLQNKLDSYNIAIAAYNEIYNSEFVEKNKEVEEREASKKTIENQLANSLELLKEEYLENYNALVDLQKMKSDMGDSNRLPAFCGLAETEKNKYEEIIKDIINRNSVDSILKQYNVTDIENALKSAFFKENSETKTEYYFYKKDAMGNYQLFNNYQNMFSDYFEKIMVFEENSSEELTLEETIKNIIDSRNKYNTFYEKGEKLESFLVNTIYNFKGNLSGNLNQVRDKNKDKQSYFENIKKLYEIIYSAEETPSGGIYDVKAPYYFDSKELRIKASTSTHNSNYYSSNYYIKDHNDIYDENSTLFTNCLYSYEKFKEKWEDTDLFSNIADKNNEPIFVLDEDQGYKVNINYGDKQRDRDFLFNLLKVNGNNKNFFFEEINSNVIFNNDFLKDYKRINLDDYKDNDPEKTLERGLYFTLDFLKVDNNESGVNSYEQLGLQENSDYYLITEDLAQEIKGFKNQVRELRQDLEYYITPIFIYDYTMEFYNNDDVEQITVENFVRTFSQYDNSNPDKNLELEIKNSIFLEYSDKEWRIFTGETRGDSLINPSVLEAEEYYRNPDIVKDFNVSNSSFISFFPKLNSNIFDFEDLNFDEIDKFNEIGEEVNTSINNIRNRLEKSLLYKLYVEGNNNQNEEYTLPQNLLGEELLYFEIFHSQQKDNIIGISSDSLDSRSKEFYNTYKDWIDITITPITLDKFYEDIGREYYSLIDITLTHDDKKTFNYNVINLVQNLNLNFFIIDNNTKKMTITNSFDDANLKYYLLKKDYCLYDYNNYVNQESKQYISNLNLLESKKKSLENYEKTNQMVADVIAIISNEEEVVAREDDQDIEITSTNIRAIRTAYEDQIKTDSSFKESYLLNLREIQSLYRQQAGSYISQKNYYVSNEFTLTNEIQVPSAITMDNVQALTLECDSMGSKGNYLFYNEISGEIISSVESNKIRAVEAFYDPITSDKTIESLDYIIWKVPIVNTMIETPTERFGFDLARDEVKYVDALGVEQANKANASYILIKKTNEGKQFLNFKIKSKYMETAINNTIYCITEDRGIPITTYTNLHFGYEGTNGTNYTFYMKMEEGLRIGKIKEPKNRKVVISAYLFDSFGQEMSMAIENFKLELEDKDQNNILNSVQNQNDNYTLGESTVTIKNEGYHLIIEIENFLGGMGSYFVLKGIYSLSKQNKKDRAFNQLVSYLPIPFTFPHTDDRPNGNYFKSGENPNFLIEGPDKIVYDSSGGNPTYYKKEFRLINSDTNKVINSLKEINQNTNEIKESSVDKPIQWRIIIHGDSNNEGNFYPSIRDNKIVVPSTYFKGLKNVELQAYIEGKDNDEENTVIELAAIPIRIYQNQYEFSLLNDWDGNLTLDQENGIILSSMVAAGKKEEDNTYSGVLMGEIAKWNSTDNTLGPAETGIFGYQKGINTFSFLDTGTATLGASGQGQIILKGDSGKIYSGNWDITSNNNHNGMLIDLTLGKLEAKNFDGTLENSFMFDTQTTSNKVFEIKASQGNNNESRIALEKGTIILESTGGGNRSRIDLGSNSFNIKAISNDSTLEISNITGNNYFLVAAKENDNSTNQTNLFQLRVNSNGKGLQNYLLRSFGKHNATNLNTQTEFNTDGGMGINIMKKWICLNSGRYEDKKANTTERYSMVLSSGWNDTIISVNRYFKKNSESKIETETLFEIGKTDFQIRSQGASFSTENGKLSIEGLFISSKGQTEEIDDGVFKTYNIMTDSVLIRGGRIGAFDITPTCLYSESSTFGGKGIYLGDKGFSIRKNEDTKNGDLVSVNLNFLMNSDTNLGNISSSNSSAKDYFNFYVSGAAGFKNGIYVYTNTGDEGTTAGWKKYTPRRKAFLTSVNFTANPHNDPKDTGKADYTASGQLLTWKVNHSLKAPKNGGAVTGDITLTFSPSSLASYLSHTHNYDKTTSIDITPSKSMEYIYYISAQDNK